MQPTPLNLYIGKYDVPDPEFAADQDVTMPVPALFMFGFDEPLWIAPTDRYYNNYGDRFDENALKEVYDQLKEVFKGTKPPA